MAAKTKQLYTTWGENLNPSHVLEEYPRPGLKRESYKNLNGIWEYAITDNSEVPVMFQGEILVPFSPESILSGVKKQIVPENYLWYRREIRIEPDFILGKLILHFGAVDQYCRVYLNGHLTATHKGGYLPFSIDITKYMNTNPDVSNQLIVMVRDTSDSSYHARGKQCLKRGGMFYTAQSGIWQTVWMESVPDYYIEHLKITPHFDKSQIEIWPVMKGKAITYNSTQEREIADDSDKPNNIQIYEEDKRIISKKIHHIDKIIVKIPEAMSWSPEHPFLYTFKLRIGQDQVEGYFAMRKFSVGNDQNGISRLMLNNQPYFHNGVLDQGYWSDGLYTAPSDEALIYDIQTMKEMGFNMIRKHIKIEPLRWYYHCDRLGMLVWQDLVNGGAHYNYLLVTYLPALFFNSITSMKDNQYKLLAREDVRGRREFEREMKATVELLYNIPSIAMWVPFNEGWGQFDAKRIASQLRKLDSTRMIDHASGWFDQKAGHVKSIHIYFRKIGLRPDSRVIVLSEFGGYVCRIEEHSFNNKVFGYKLFKTREKLLKGFRKLYIKEMIPTMAKGLSAAVYTQLSDVEDEVNGILTFDRKVIKLEKRQVKHINSKVMKAFNHS